MNEMENETQLMVPYESDIDFVPARDDVQVLLGPAEHVGSAEMGEKMEDVMHEDVGSVWGTDRLSEPVPGPAVPEQSSRASAC